MSTTPPEGYPSELFIGDVVMFECELCHCVVCNAVEHSVCSQLYCEACIQAALPRMKQSACPHCMTPATRGDFRRMNRILKDLLDSHEMRCVNSPRCDAMFRFGQLEKHLSTCPFQPIQCPHEGCKQGMLRIELADHKVACPFRPEVCMHCFGNVPACQMELHKQTKCLLFPIPCRHCGIAVPRGHMAQHHQESCDKHPVACSIKGCGTLVSRDEQTQHIEGSLGTHLMQMQEQMTAMARTISDLQSEVTVLRMELQTKGEIISQLEARARSEPFGGAVLGGGFQNKAGPNPFRSAGFGGKQEAPPPPPPPPPPQGGSLFSFSNPPPLPGRPASNPFTFSQPAGVSR